jgi:hypothetical protein
MRINKEFVPACPVLRSFMPTIRITIADMIITNEKLHLYLAVKHPHRSTTFALKANEQKKGLLEVKVIHNNQELSPQKIFDSLFGVGIEDYPTVITSLINELFEVTAPFNGCDSSKTMLEIISWQDKKENHQQPVATPQVFADAL